MLECYYEAGVGVVVLNERISNTASTTMNESAAVGGGDKMGHLDQTGQVHEFDDFNVDFGTIDDGNDIFWKHSRRSLT